MTRGPDDVTHGKGGRILSPDQQTAGGKMIQSGELTAVRVGREYRVPAAALETWLEENS